jgi:translocation and assembly module TamB
LSSGDTIARSVGDTFGFDDMRVESSDGGEKASLVIGRYITPELYVSYGVGFLDSINVFKIRYQISDNWQMVGENGEAQGADLLYTLER